MTTPNHEKRIALLARLVKCEQPLDGLVAELSEFGWDSEDELVLLTLVDAKKAISRYRNGEIEANELESWAEAIEGRDDVGLELRHETLLRRLIFELANPEVVREVSPDRADSWIAEIECAATM